MVIFQPPPPPLLGPGFSIPTITLMIAITFLMQGIVTDQVQPGRAFDPLHHDDGRAISV